jgi:hypothetical protein
MARHRDSNNGTETPRVGPVLAGVIEGGAFLSELAMLVVLFIGGWGLGSGGLMSIALAVFYPALAILIWSLWMAPTAQRRLADPWRLIAQVALFVATAVLVGLGGHPIVGIVFAVVAGALFVAARFTGGVTGGSGRPDDDGADAHAGSSSSS